MNNPSNKVSEFFNGESETENFLWHYVKSLTPDTVSQLSQPSSPEVFQVLTYSLD